jgi:hypothetical protein
MEDIADAIRHGAEAGKLRAFVRKNGTGLAGLTRLADRHTAAATAALEKVAGSATGYAPRLHALGCSSRERVCGEG